MLAGTGRLTDGHGDSYIPGSIIIKDCYMLQVLTSLLVANLAARAGSPAFIYRLIAAR